MTHFVPIPPDNEFWRPKLKELSLFDMNGTASISVWRVSPHWKLKVRSRNPRFVAQAYSTQGDLTSFYLRGLIAGDEVAVFDLDDKQQTAWLPIKFVAGDRQVSNRDSGNLPRSKHKENFILDAYGAEQRHPPIKEADWLREVEAAIEKMRRNQVGQIVTDAVRVTVMIRPTILTLAVGETKAERIEPGNENSDTFIVFTPQEWKGLLPSTSADETLLHELCHVVDQMFANYLDHSGDGLQFDRAEFFAITVTNVYSSMVGRPLRADHRGHRPMPSLYANASNGAAKFRANHDRNFTTISTRLPTVARNLASVSAPWNPFK